jgi:serine/threonine-protein kinase
MRRAPPLSSAATAADPALAATRTAEPPRGVGARGTATLRAAGEDTFSARTVGAFEDQGGEAEGDVRASLAPPADADGEARYAEGPLLGVGGMGEVRLHVDRRIGRPVALKKLHEDMRGARSLARFLREARVQGQLEHPSIVPVYDLGSDEHGRPYFTMKRVRGQTLAHILERLAKGDATAEARFSRHKLLGAFRQVCLAMQYAHERGVIHRDLKPGNLMMGAYGEVYVLDWGIAKATADAPADDGAEVPSSSMPQMTRAGDLIGTPLYMSPEQLRADHEVLDARSDVYALGAILFEILTRTPYRAPDTLEKLVARADDAHVELASARAPDVPPELDQVCACALAPDPAHRLGSALAIADAVERYLDGDRDAATRRALAEKLVTSARERLASGPDARVAAMRDALKALALVPDDVETQRLLLSLVVDGSGALPDSAEREFSEGDLEVRRQGTRLGIYGYISWLAALPLSIWAGIRDWRLPALLTLLTLACIAVATRFLRSGARDTRAALALALLSGAVVATVSGWLGPFVLVPLAACATAVMFVMHSTHAERRWLLAVWVGAALAPFAAEALGVFPPAYSFRGGDLILHARGIELSPGPTIIALVYTSVSFLVLLLVFVGRLRDRQREAERRLFVQAWHLRQLFPAGDAAPADERG